MQRKDLLVLLVAFVFTITLFLAIWAAFEIINPPPITGYISGKNRYLAYFPADVNTPEVFHLAITDDSGKLGASWIVSEERWNLYEIGDQVGWLPKYSKE